jgi:multicomponent Na+:H+ antiporter subunit B
MSRLTRKIVFVVSAVALAAVFWLGYGNLAPFGHIATAYAQVVNAITVPQRHITDAVTDVNFDIRGFDTLGEEFILFTSVIGVVLLMRKTPHEEIGDHEDKIAARKVPFPSDAVRVSALFLVPPTVLFGWYIVSHGQVSPGGGFQGGVILASAPLLVYLCAAFPEFRKAAPPRLIEVTEAIGAAGYIAVGVACVALGALFLQNVLPLGQSGSVTGGGTVVYIDVAVGLEVSGGFVLALLSYLAELMERKES